MRLVPSPTSNYGIIISVNVTTGAIPFTLMFACQATLPIEIMFVSPLELSKTSSSEYALNLRKRKKMYHLMRETLNTTKVTKTNLSWKDTWQSILNWWFILATFSCCIRGHTRKLHKPWKRPFKVINKINDVLYRIHAVYLHICLIIHFDEHHTSREK